MIPQLWKTTRVVLLMICSSLLFPCIVFTQTIYVKTDGTGNGSSWAMATADLAGVLATASSGTEVWVAAGTYYPTTCTTCTATDREQTFVIPDGVAVYGGFMGNETMLTQRDWTNHQTILSADINQDNSLDSNAFTIVYTENVGSTTLLDGFTLTGANANPTSGYSSADPQRSGGGFYNEANVESNPSIRNCRFENNFADGFGAAIYNDGRNGGSANPDIRNCVFVNNSVRQSGGAIFNDASLESGASSPTIIHCVFEDNSAKFGGAIYNSGLRGNSSPQIISCRFLNNEASSYGGACYNFGKGTEGITTPLYANCVFIDNQASSAGGIYSLADGGFTHPEIVNCTFYGNQANTGGGVYCNESGGGDTEVSISNCIFWNNTAGFNPTFHMSGSGTPRMNLSHCLLDATDCDDIMFLDPQDSLNCVGGLIYNQIPQFTDIASNNFHLQSSSPAKNQGDNDVIDQYAIYFDMDSLIRVHNEVVDFGAYELDAPEYIAPSIIDEPLPQNICEGNSLSFSVEVSGTGAIDYQWQKDGQDIVGATQTTYTIPVADLADQAVYRCRVTSFVMDVVFSETVSATINALQTVQNTIEASAMDICAGSMVSFSATSGNGGTNPAYQWQVNGEDVGSDSPTYNTTNLADGDVITCIFTSSLDCVETGTVSSNPISIAVTDLVASTISINTNSTTICAGENLSFNAIPTNGGINPSYQWQVNGEDVGSDNPSYNTTNLADGDVITCILTSSMDCIETSAVSSNSIAVSVTEVVASAISVSANTSESCAGETISFSATPTNGGTNPAYQWQVNGEDVGSNSPNYNNANLTDGDEVTCILTSSMDCIETNEVSSNSIAVSVTDLVEVAVSINASSTELCANELVSFSAMPINGGINPGYQWQLNGMNVGSNSSTYAVDNLTDGDEITCILSSSMDCVQNNEANSNAIAISIVDVVAAAVSINTASTAVCASELVSFSATPTNGGTNPSYQWQVNGMNVGDNSPSYSANNLSDGDEVMCILSSSADCVQASEVSSNAIALMVTDLVDATVSINTNSTSICDGDLLTFSASATNGGAEPIYQWQLNGNPVGINSSTYVSSSFADGDQVQCILFSSLECVSNSSVGSEIIDLEVLPQNEVSVEIEADLLTACAGTELHFTAQGINGGDNPTYQWQINGLPVGENDPSFSSSDLQDNDLIQCTLISSMDCTVNSEASSNSFMVDILPNIIAEVSISASNLEPCVGVEVSFIADAVNGGTNPIYQWQVNGEDIAYTESNWVTSDLQDGDQVACLLISSESCVSNNSTISNTLNLTVQPLLDLTVSIEANTLEACEGMPINLMVSNQNGGTEVIYDWQINGESTGITSTDFSSVELQEGDMIQCVATSNKACLNMPTVASNSLEIEACTTTSISTISDLSVQLFPNPAQTYFQVYSPQLSGPIDLTIFDLSGQKRLEKHLQWSDQNQPETIQLDRFSDGVYIVMLIQGTTIFTQKLLIQN